MHALVALPRSQRPRTLSLRIPNPMPAATSRLPNTLTMRRIHGRKLGGFLLPEPVDGGPPLGGSERRRERCDSLPGAAETDRALRIVVREQADGCRLRGLPGLR